MSDDQRNPASGSTHSAPPPISAARVMGSIFLVFGILVMGLSGLCTGVYLISILPAAWNGSPGDFLNVLGLGAVVGGTPFVVGLLFFWIGRRMR